MYLKKVKLRNFKSFAGATEIPFQPGFTGVAGPNGMGKSNISDAILFVLGPTSSKALRADRLTHLFFNGGASKKPATECEVSLVFDNSDHLLPAEAAEVEVTRYVKLAPSDPDGYYSYFYINGKRSTQSEIDTLLSHARLSGDGYNLVQQGLVNQVVTMGPIPRRGLVERLAGISLYDEELERAAVKRTELDQNLSRISTLLGDVKNRLAALENQRLQAIQYKQLAEEKKKSEARMARATHSLAEKELASCRAQVEHVQAEIAQLDASREKLVAQQNEVAQSIDKLEREIAEAGGEAALKLKSELDTKKLNYARAEQVLTNLREAVDALQDRADEIAKTITGEESQHQQFSKQAAELDRKVKALDEQASTDARELESATGTPGKSQEKLAGARKHQLELDRQIEAHQVAWQSAVAAKEGAAGALAGAERDHAQAEEDLAEREVEVRDLEGRLGENDKGRGGAKTPTAELQKQLFALKNREGAITTEADRLSKEVAELNRRYISLDARIKARAESGAKPTALAAVDFLLSQRNLGKVAGIRGTVEELAEFDPKYKTALQVAAGSRFQAIVVESDQVAETCIKLLREEKRGRATFLPLNKMLPGRPHGKSLIAAKAAGSEGYALDLVHFDEALRPAFWFAFSETVVMSDLSHAREQMGGVRLVTLSGDLIEATGAISGGYLDPSGQGRGADSAQELKRLGDEMREKSATEATAREELRSLAEKIKAAAEELAQRSIHDQAQASTRGILDKDLAAAKEKLRSVRDRLAKAAQAQEKAATTLKASETKLAGIAAELEELKSARQKAGDEYLAQLPQALSSRLKQLQEKSQATQDERVRANGDLQAVRTSVAALETQIDAHRKELDRAKAELSAKRREIEEGERGLAHEREALEALKAVEAKQSETSRAQLLQQKKLTDRRVAIASELATVETNLTTRRSMLTNESTRAAQAEAKLAEMEQALQQYPEADPDEKPMPLEEVRKRIAALEQQLAAMGDVNQRAVEEYDAEKARLDEFSSEVERLTKEKDELVALVKEIEQKKREKVVEVVRQVGANFKEIYGELSAGGEGEIALENPDDPLGGGLLIKARPIGKTVARLEQLSGGEKSLASLAFIFALQRYDPSPLYVFDEVDMSLDGLNAEYVGRMLRRNAERAQFVVISLRKVTLKFAHQLFGVTMRGDGCSRVVGMHLDDIQDVEDRSSGEGPSGPAPKPVEAQG
jgi:chromosome segregation protein